MLFWFQEIDIENQRPPKDTAYTENPYEILADYQDVAALANAYLNGIIVENDQNMSSRRDLEILPPFAFPFQQKLSWSNVQFSNNIILPIDTAYNEHSKNIQIIKSQYSNDDDLNINYPEEINPENAEPIALSGILEATVPKQVLQFKFSNNEAGDTKTQNGIKVKLVSIKGHAVKVIVTNPNGTDASLGEDKPDDVQILATDKTKQFLSSSGSSTGPDDMTDYYKNILNKIVDNPENAKSLEEDLIKEQERFEKKHKNQSYHTRYFKGTVEDVVIYVLDYSKANKIKKQVKLPAYSFKNSSDTRPIIDIPATLSVYDRTISGMLNQKNELRQQELANEIKIDQTAYKKPGKAWRTRGRCSV